MAARTDKRMHRFIKAWETLIFFLTLQGLVRQVITDFNIQQLQVKDQTQLEILFKWLSKIKGLYLPIQCALTDSQPFSSQATIPAGITQDRSDQLHFSSP